MANRNEQLREYEMEAALLSGAEDRYGIYQIADGTRAEEYAFMSMDFVEKNGMKVLREDYQLVYSGILGADETLDTLYEKFNLYHPEDFKGHSLSVSDIVVLHTDGGNVAHYVDSFGFREVPDFLNLEEERVYSLIGDKPDKYLQIQTSDEGFDYTFYDANYRLLDGGIITNENQSIDTAVREIVLDAGVQISDRIADVEGFMEKVEEVEQEEIAKAAKRMNQSNDAKRKPQRYPEDTGKKEPENKNGHVSESSQPEAPYVEYYVAECDEYHDLGTYYTFPDVRSAAEKYREILDDPRKKYLGNGMGIIYHGKPGDIYNNSECSLVLKEVVCGDSLDYVPGLAEKTVVREALRLIREELSEFRYKMPRYEKEAEDTALTAEELAVRLDRLAHDFDPYDYQDRLNGSEDLVLDITYRLYTGGVRHYASFLDDVIREGGSLATEADRLKEKLAAFDPYVSDDRVPMVRVNYCESDKFAHEKYLPINEFDKAVADMDREWSERNAGKDENAIETCMLQFTVYYPEDGKMKTLKDSLNIGLGNGRFIDSMNRQVEDRLTDPNWLTYKRNQGQGALDAFVSALTDIQEHVLPHLQSFCSLQERAPEQVEAMQTVPVVKDRNLSNTASAVTVPKTSPDAARAAKPPSFKGERKSIHQRLEINKEWLKSQPGKKEQVKGVDRSCDE